MDVSLLDKRALNALTQKERMFVLEFMVCGNGTQAAINAGYAKNSAGVTAAKLMKRPLIISALAKCNDQVVEYMELNLKAAIDKAMAGVYRTSDDTVDPETGLIYTDFRKLGRNAKKTMDGIKQKVREYLNEDGVVTHRDIESEIRCMPSGTAIDIVAKMAGGYAPTKTESVTATFDFDKLYTTPPKPEDIVQKRLAELEAQRTLETTSKEVADVPNT